MEEFEITGNGNFIRITFNEVHGFPNETGHWGGYDVTCGLKIEIDDFSVNSYFYSSTGEIFEFYQYLLKANEDLSGAVYFRNYEENLVFKLQYDVNGVIMVDGTFFKDSHKLNFDYPTDQSYIQSTLTQLKSIVLKYGGMKGVK